MVSWPGAAVLPDQESASAKHARIRFSLLPVRAGGVDTRSPQALGPLRGVRRSAQQVLMGSETSTQAESAGPLSAASGSAQGPAQSVVSRAWTSGCMGGAPCLQRTQGCRAGRAAPAHSLINEVSLRSSHTPSCAWAWLPCCRPGSLFRDTWACLWGTCLVQLHRSHTEIPASLW